MYYVGRLEACQPVCDPVYFYDPARGRFVIRRPYLYVIGERPRLPRDKFDVHETDYTPYVYSKEELGYREGRGRVWQVYAKSPSLIPELREWLWERGYKTSQSYIKFAGRVSADAHFAKTKPGAVLKNVSAVLEEALSRRPKIVALDVEVVGGNVLIGVATQDGDVLFTKSPRDVAALDFSYVVTYNGWEFDYRYMPLVKGSKYLAESARGPAPHLDLFVVATSRMRAGFGVSEANFGLYDVALQLGVEKELGLGEGELLRMKMLRNKLETLTEAELKEYLALDAVVTLKIAERWVPILEALGALTGVNPLATNQLAESVSQGHLAEILIHSYLAERGIVLEDRRRALDYEKGDATRAAGVGLFRNVAEYDFSAMYPSLMVQDGVDPVGIRRCAGGFRVKLSGVEESVCFDGGPVWEVYKGLYEARKSTKALKAKHGEAPDLAVKILANSGYGILGKSGVGVVNEYCAAYIAQKTEAVFNDLWHRYRPVYGDTDSLYLQGVGEPEKFAAEINAYLAERHGQLMHVKFEGLWRLFYIPPTEAGRASEKTYVKVGEKVVIKGGKLKAHGMPLGAKPLYREWVVAVLEGASAKALAEEFANKAPLEELFISFSKTVEDVFFVKGEGRFVSKVDASRLPAYAWFAYKYGSVVAKPAEGGVEVGGRLLGLKEFVTFGYLPVDKYAFYVYDGEPYYVEFQVAFYQSAKALRIVRKVVRRVGEEEVRRHAVWYLLNESPLKYFKQGTLLAYV